jgi:serine O-acetyltransferase
MTEHKISAVTPDWSREQKSFFEWVPSKSLLASIRRYQAAGEKPALIGWFIKSVAIFQYRFWSVVTGADIPVNTEIQGGLLIPHPNGIVIHPDVKIGPNCLILQQVTIGAIDNSGTPQIAGHVDIGAGAKVLGPIVVNEHAKIGANAVVLLNVPANKTAVGIPARIL